jgi:hypothetical protein
MTAEIKWGTQPDILEAGSGHRQCSHSLLTKTIRSIGQLAL